MSTKRMIFGGSIAVAGLFLGVYSTHAGPVSLPFFEGFNTPSADAVVDYPAFTATGVQSRTVDAGGILRLGAGSHPSSHWFSVTPTPAASRIIVINVDLGFEGQPGSGATGIKVGENLVLFHPGFSGPPGALRVEGPGGFPNENMGFTPALGVLHHLEIISLPSGLFNVHVVDGNNPANRFSKDFVNPASYGGEVGPAAIAGASAFYDNLSIRTVPIPEPVSMGLTAIASLFLLCARKRLMVPPQLGEIRSFQG
jgi:hypothetical protein